MRKKNPFPPGSMILSELRGIGVSVAAAADAMRVSPKLLGDVIKGRRPITAELALRLETSLGGKPNYWLDLQTAWDMAEIRKRRDEITATVRRLAPAEEIA